MIATIPIPDPPGEDYERAVKSRLDAAYPAKMPVHTYQELVGISPSLFTNHMVVCSNGNSGSICLAFSDGFNWRIVEIGGNISL